MAVCRDREREGRGGTGGRKIAKRKMKWSERKKSTL